MAPTPARLGPVLHVTPMGWTEQAPHMAHILGLARGAGPVVCGLTQTQGQYRGLVGWVQLLGHIFDNSDVCNEIRLESLVLYH